MYDNAYDQSDSADLESEGRVMSNVINMGGGYANLQEKTISAAQTEQSVTPPSGVDGFSKVTVKAAPLQTKGVVPSYTQQRVTADVDYYGLGAVVVGALTGEKAIVKSAATPYTTQSFKVANDVGIDNVTSVTIYHNSAATGTVEGTVLETYNVGTNAGVELLISSAGPTVQSPTLPMVAADNKYVSLFFSGAVFSLSGSYTVIITGT